MKPYLFVLTAALVSSPVFANQAPHEDLGLDASFSSQRAGIEAALAEGEIYKELSPEDRVAVLAALQRMEDLLAGSEDLGDLAPSAQTQLINDQEQVNQLLTQAAEDSVLVCTHEQRLGTKIRESICLTRAERNRANDTSRKDADDRLSNLRAQPLTAPKGN